MAMWQPLAGKTWSGHFFSFAINRRLKKKSVLLNYSFIFFANNEQSTEEDKTNV